MNQEYKYRNCLQAASKNDFEELKRMHENNYGLNNLIVNHAIIYENLEMLDYAIKNGCDFSDSDSILVVHTNNIDIVKYCHNNGLHFNEEATLEASLRNNIKILKYLIENGCPIHDEATSHSVLTKDNIECLQYLTEKGAQKSINVTLYASQSGNIEALKYCFNHDYMWHPRSIINATLNGYFECLKFIIEKSGFDINQNLVSLLISKIRTIGHLECLEYCVNNKGINISDNMLNLFREDTNISIDFDNIKGTIRKFLFDLYNDHMKIRISALGIRIKEEMDKIELQKKYTKFYIKDNLCKDIVDHCILEYF